MFKKVLLTSILTIVATTTFVMADGDKKVTSKNYVDTAVATKQDIINLTDSEGFVMIYDGINEDTGQAMFDAREIYPDESLDEWDGVGKTTGAMIPNVDSVWLALRNRQNKMTCAGWPDGVAHTDENCWLWNKN